MAMMIMVRDIKGAGETDYDPQINKSDIIYKEVTGERTQALQVCTRILQVQQWSWKSIEKELRQRPSDGWESPGEEVDLAYLRVDMCRSL